MSRSLVSRDCSLFFLHRAFAFVVALGFVARRVALHRVSMRTLEEPFSEQARCRLGFERRVDAAISRPVSKTKADSQSSEHGVIATDKHRQASSCYSVEGYIRFLRDPDAVEQDRQLPSDGNGCLIPGLLAAPSCQMQSPLSECGILPTRP